jgi:hypothetical protein
MIEAIVFPLLMVGSIVAACMIEGLPKPRI